VQLQRTKCERNFSPLLSWNCWLLLELSVSALFAHTFWTLAEFGALLAPLNSQTKHIPRRLRPAFITFARKLIVSQRHPLFHDTAIVSV